MRGHYLPVWSELTSAERLKRIEFTHDVMPHHHALRADCERDVELLSSDLVDFKTGDVHVGNEGPRNN